MAVVQGWFVKVSSQSAPPVSGQKERPQPNGLGPSSGYSSPPQLHHSTGVLVKTTLGRLNIQYFHSRCLRCLNARVWSHCCRYILDDLGFFMYGESRMPNSISMDRRIANRYVRAVNLTTPIPAGSPGGPCTRRRGRTGHLPRHECAPLGCDGLARPARPLPPVREGAA